MKETYLWEENIEIKKFPSINKDLKTDVLIIGGGITGILCAYELKKRNIKVDKYISFFLYFFKILKILFSYLGFNLSVGIVIIICFLANFKSFIKSSTEDSSLK